MTDSDREIERLAHEHQAIRAHVKLLVNSVSNLAGRPIEEAQAAGVGDHIRSYHLTLLDLRDGIKQHIELDELILQALFGNSASREDLTREHEEIRRRVDHAIELADMAVEKYLDQDKLIRSAVIIREEVESICALVEAHTAKEDRLFKP